MDNEIKPHVIADTNGDVDADGQLALALFTGGIVVLLIVIYALAAAA